MTLRKGEIQISLNEFDEGFHLEYYNNKLEYITNRKNMKTFKNAAEQ